MNNIIYLNNAGQAWLDPQVVDVGQEMLQQPPFMNCSVEDVQQKIRQSFATLIGAQPEEIAIVPSTAFAITLAANNIQRLYLQQQKKTNNGTSLRSKILLLEDQFCSAVYPWQEICEKSCDNGQPLTLEVVPAPITGGWTEAVLSLLADTADKILVACLPPLHWSDGAIVDLAQIAPVCHENNILLIVDATQAAGIMPESVKQIRPAFLACSIHKWLRSPPGASLVYIDKDLYEHWQPLDKHGRSRNMKDGPCWESYPNAMTKTGYPERFFRDARKFDGGGKPNPIVLPMLQKSLELVLKRVDLETCQSQLRSMSAPLLEWIARNQNKFTLPSSPHVYHLMGIRPTGQWLLVSQMLEIAKKLQTEHKIYIAVRCGVFRVAPYLDTTIDEMKAFVETFERVVAPYWEEMRGQVDSPLTF